MAIDTKIIANLDGSLTVASQQNDKVVKKLAELNTKDKFHNRSTQYKGDSVISVTISSTLNLKSIEFLKSLPLFPGLSLTGCGSL